MSFLFNWASRVNGHCFSAALLKMQHSILPVASFGLRGSSDDFGGSVVLWYSLKGSLGVTDCSSVRTGTLRLCICAHLKVVEVRMFGPPFRRCSAFSLVQWSFTFLHTLLFFFLFPFDWTRIRRDDREEAPVVRSRWSFSEWGGVVWSSSVWYLRIQCNNAHSFFSFEHSFTF